ncbi:hypothetical protein X170_00520 [Mycobacterium tuberculosis BTB10-258]|nr:hypothetical protein CH84_02011 [Mycobacterium tuberculosis]KCB80687.1 hypothetical protein X170_00520 [Mycobacterium tuberculosis BTB10-258]BAX43911.1 TetR family transcriptional regulator [Mycobacterium tuberculosis]
MRWSAPPRSCSARAGSRRYATGRWRGGPVCRWRLPPNYFSSLDDLIARAVEHIGMIEVAQLRARVSALSRRRRGPETTAVVLVDLLVGEMSSPGLAEQLISRYERHIACTRLPDLRESMRRSLRQRAEAVAEAIERSGRSAQIELVCTLICAVDGSVVSALVEGRDPRAAALATVVDLIDVLAPVDQRPVPF